MCRRTVVSITILLISSFVTKSQERALVGEETNLLTQNEIPTEVTGKDNEVGTHLMDGEIKSEARDMIYDRENFENETENQLNEQSSSKTNSSEESKPVDVVERGIDENSDISKRSQEGSSNISEYVPNGIVQSNTINPSIDEAKIIQEGEIIVEAKESVQVSAEEIGENNKIQFPEDGFTITDVELNPRMFENTESAITKTKYVDGTGFGGRRIKINEEYSTNSTEPATFKNEAAETENTEKLADNSTSNQANAIELTTQLPSFEKIDSEPSVIIELPIYEKASDASFNVERADSANLPNDQEPKTHRADLLNFEEKNLREEAIKLSVLQTKDELQGKEKLNQSIVDLIDSRAVFDNKNVQRNSTADLANSIDLSSAVNSTATSKLPAQKTPTQSKQDPPPGAWYSKIVALFPTYVLNPFNYFGNTPTPWNYTSFLNYSSLNFPQLLRSQSVASTLTSTVPTNSERNTITNSTQLQLIPFFKIFKFVPYNASVLAQTDPSNSTNTTKAPQQQLAIGANNDHEAFSVRFQTQNIRQIWPYYDHQGHQPVMTFIELQPSQTNNYPVYSVQPANIKQNQTPANAVPIQQVSIFNRAPLTHSNPIIEIDVREAIQKLNRTTTPVVNTPKKTSSTSLMVEMVMPTPIIKFMKNFYNLFVTTN